jgi:uncharacterized Tic20 family protein
VALQPSPSARLASFAHLSTLANSFLPPLGTILPLALWLAKRGKDELAVDSAKEAINFQISTVLWALAFIAPVLAFPALAYVAWAALVALWIAWIILPIVAAIHASRGARYYYPYTWHVFGEGPGG